MSGASADKQQGETQMTHSAEREPARQYAEAHAAHYTAKNLRTALESYHRIIMAHPASPEAGYSRTQILNIASRIISKDVLLEAQRTLALAELGEDRDSRIPDPAPHEAVPS
jgi:outer membrane protein assembly factor BamD (BamD/ComL family)